MARNATTAKADPVPTIEEEFMPLAPVAEPAPPMAVEGMEDWNPDDIVIPRLRIVQPTSRDGNSGRYQLNLSGEEFQEMRVFFVKAQKTRVMFIKGDLTAPPVCGSNDRVRPHERFEQPMAETCAACPYGQWQGKTPPECNESYTLLGVDIETYVPFFLSVKSTGVRPAKAFLSYVMLTARQKKAMLPDFEVTLKLKEITNDKGRFFVPVFASPTYRPDRPYRDEAELYKHEEARFDDEQTVSAGGNDDSPI